MPNVAGVEYPYTPQGIAAAQQAYSGLVGGGVPQSGRGMLQDLFQQRQPTFQDVSHRPEQPTLNPASQRPGGNYLQDLMQFKALQEMMQSQAGIADQYQPQTSFGQFGNPTTQQPNLGGFGQSAAGALRPFQSQPTSNFGQLVGRAVGGVQPRGGYPGIQQGQATQFGQSPWQRPITQTPRGRTANIGQTPTPRGQTTGTTPGAGYGSSSGQTAQQPTFSSVSHRPQQPTFSSISHRPKQPTFSSISHRPPGE